MVAATVGMLLSHRRRPGDAADAAPAGLTRPVQESRPVQAGRATEGSRELTMDDVLGMAQAARQHLAESLDDYTARFVKRERDSNGVLEDETVMQLKVQTRLRGDTEQAPMRVYMRFQAPPSVEGREVIWGEDLYDGKMAVHEVGLLLGMKTFWLDPHGIIAMQGQRYPITEIGLVRLVEKLIERGQQDRDNPDVSVTLTDNHPFADINAQLIQVRRSEPSGTDDDFSLAEIVIDQPRQMILSYRTFGWPTDSGQPPPLLESYTYHDVKTNVGLRDQDFETTNPEYGFPAL
jgi:outer membrane lipoprotein-sorting protein